MAAKLMRTWLGEDGDEHLLWNADAVSAAMQVHILGAKRQKYPVSQQG